MRKRGQARRAEPVLVTRIDNRVTRDYQYRSLAYRPSALGRSPASVPARHSCNNGYIAGVIKAKSAVRRRQHQTGPRARVNEATSSPHHCQWANRFGTPPDRRYRIGILVCPVREYSPLPRPPSPAEPRTTRFMACQRDTGSTSPQHGRPSPNPAGRRCGLNRYLAQAFQRPQVCRERFVGAGWSRWSQAAKARLAVTLSSSLLMTR